MSEPTRDAGTLLTTWLKEFHSRNLDLQRLILLRTRRDDIQGREEMSIMFASAAEALTGLEHVEVKLKEFIVEEQRQMVRGRKVRRLVELQKKRMEAIRERLPGEVLEGLKEEEDGGVEERDKENVRSVGNGERVVHGDERDGRVVKGDKRKEEVKVKERVEKRGGMLFVGDVNEDELRRAPSYVKGRLKLDKVNAVVEKINKVAETKYKLLAKPRAQLTSADFDKLTDYEQGDCSETEGCRFITDADIRASGELRIDSTTKGVINLLRHIGAIKEIRGKSKVRIFIFN